MMRFVAIAALFFSVSTAAVALAQEPNALQTASALEQRMVEAIARAENSVVAIARVRQDRPRGEEGSAADRLQPRLPPRFGGQEVSPTDPDFIPNEFGAGVVVDQGGLILTNYHVLGEVSSSNYYVWSKRKPFNAAVVGADPWFDLAVLKVDAGGLLPVTFGDAKELKKGRIVIALGNPYAIARDGEVSASWGIISNLLRRAPRTPERSKDPKGRETLHHYGTLIETDARLNLGFSGGALINLSGEMIGLTTSYAATAGYETAAGFAIPVDEHFKRTVEELKQGRKPEFGFLGVSPQPLDESLRRRGRHGARVLDVVPGTPAASADLRAGDVISHINGQPVYDDNDLFRLVGSMAPEMTAILKFARGDLERGRVEVYEKQVTLSKKHVGSWRPQIGTVPEANWRGMRVDYATASPTFGYLGGQLDPDGCVYVAAVDRDSPAWNGGVRAGGFVSHAGNTRVASPKEFYAAVSNAEGDVRLRVVSGQGPAVVRTVSP